MILERPAPQAPEAERALVGGVLLYPDRIHDVEVDVRPEHFNDRWIGRCWEALLALAGAGEDINPLSVCEVMERIGVAPRQVGTPDHAVKIVGTIEEIDRLRDSGAASLNYYAGQVREAWCCRQLMIAGQRVLNLAGEAGLSLREKLEAAEQELLNVTTAGSREVHMLDASELGELLWKRLRRLVAKEIPDDAVRTGFPALDRIVTLKPCELTLLAGRPSMGKTSVANALLRRMAFAGYRVCFVSLETPALQVAVNWAAERLSMDTRDVRDARGVAVGQSLRGDVIDALFAIRDLGDCYRVVDRGVTTPLDLRKLVRRLLPSGLQLVCVDYLQLLKDAARHPNRYQEVSEISRQLKALAIDTGVHVLALAQLNRANEDRRDKKPMMSDLRDSGQLEQDADTIMLLHRPSYYDDDADQLLLEIDVAKNRNGPTGRVECDFDRRSNKITERRAPQPWQD